MSLADILIFYSARESRATAELELLSATSSEVCEMWSGSEVVRVAGQPSTIQYILDKTSKRRMIWTLSEALKRNIYVPNSSDIDAENPNYAPSLTINVQNAISLSWQLLTLVIIGIIIQIMAFVLSAFIAYGWSWRAGSEMISSYGFPCYLAGTVLLTFGLLGCARVIQNNSRIDELSPKKIPAEYQPLCIQKACTVDAKHFLSYAIFHPEGQSTIKMSRGNERDYTLVTLCSTMVALMGYVCQFIGLRAMHWSVALIQLAATLTMTCARAFLRRGLANQPICQPLPMGTDAAGLAYIFSKVSAWELVTGTSIRNEPTFATFSDIEDIDPQVNTPCLFNALGTRAANLNPSTHLIMTAKSMSQSVPTELPTSLFAQQLINAIQAVMRIYSQRRGEGILDGEDFDCDEQCWEIQPSLRMNEGENTSLPIKTFLCSSLVPRKIGRSEAAQKSSALIADPETLSAILSLWLAVLRRRYPLNGRNDQGGNETPRQPQYYRIIGNDCVPHGVPQGKAIGKWLSPQTSLHTTKLTPVGRLAKNRQAKNAPMFGVSFSSRYLRFRPIPE